LPQAASTADFFIQNPKFSSQGGYFRAEG